MPNSSLARRALLFACSLLLALGVLELALRAVWQNPYRGEQTERVLKLALHHAERRLPMDRRSVYPDEPTVLIRTDERSYIEPGRRFERPDATVAFLGGSTTECAAVREELRFPVLVGTLLEAQGLRVNTLNAGVSGNTTHDALNVLLNHVVADRPDVAVLMQAVNDVGVLAASGSYRSRMGAPLAASAGPRWLLQAASARLALAGLLRNAVTRPIAELADFERRVERDPPPVDPAEYVKRLRAFVALCRAFGIAPVLMTEPAVTFRTELTPGWLDQHNQDRFNAEVRRVAAEEGAALIDLARFVADSVPGWDRPMVVFYDGLHVGDEGSRIYAEHIAARLRETVLAAPRAR